MSFKENIRKKWKEETGKLSKMKFRDKLWYIWEYYKLHMLGILMIGIVIYIVGLSIHNRGITSVLYGGIINDYVTDSSLEVLTDEFKDRFALDPKKQTVTMDASFYISMDQQSEMSMSASTKLTVLIASQSLDFTISDPAVFESNAALDSFLDLEAFLPEDLKSQLSEYFVYAKDNSGTEKAYGLDLSTSRYVTEGQSTLAAPTMGVIANAPNPDSVVLFIRVLFGL